ncbi:MAG: hypothetical protein C4318_08550 [Acidimicrobiia bacterium]
MGKSPSQCSEVLLEQDIDSEIRSADDASLYSMALPGYGTTLAASFPCMRSLAGADSTELIAAGVCESEARRLLASWEILRRARARCVEPVVRSPDDAAPHFVALLADSPQERVAVLSLDAAHGPISARVVFSGGLDRSIIDPKILFSGLLRERACAFILAHNHPSGSLDPSRHDIAVTDRLRTCAEFLDIAFLDHLVIGGDRWTSMRERGYLGASDSKDWGYLAS